MATHRLEPTTETLHGVFSRELAPVLTIDSGDTVLFQTPDAGWSSCPRRLEDRFGAREKYESRKPEWQEGHCLMGPVFVRGAEPGMVLEIAIDEISAGNWGWTSAGGWPHPVHQRLGFGDENTFMLWDIDTGRGVCRNQHGHEVSLQPFMGVMGLAPAEAGEHSTAPPRRVGGNLDCRELVAGAKLFLPIEVSGALFSVGDGHAAQGDGELCVTAIECPMERVALTFTLREQVSIDAPVAETADAWLTFGLHEDLQEATYRAIEGMLDLMIKQYGLPRGEAFALASLVVDLRVTQIVNGVRGVHARLPFDALRVPT